MRIEVTSIAILMEEYLATVSSHDAIIFTISFSHHEFMTAFVVVIVMGCGLVVMLLIVDIDGDCISPIQLSDVPFELPFASEIKGTICPNIEVPIFELVVMLLIVVNDGDCVSPLVQLFDVPFELSILFRTLLLVSSLIDANLL